MKSTCWVRGLGLLGCAVGLAGCGAGVPATAGPVAGTLALHGAVYGGLQPVQFARVQLFAMGTSGYGSASTSLLRTPVMTNGDGNFGLTGDYTCPSASSQVYLLVTGGNPGLAQGTNNQALALMEHLGSCGDLGPSTLTIVNELTTIAAVYTLQSFMADGTHIGTSVSNQQGLLNAGLTKAALVGLAGATPGPTAAAIATIPTVLLNTLGDVLSSCINTDGNLSAGTACGRLFAAATVPGGVGPTDTVQALLNIARYPGRNVAAMYNLITANGPYQPTLTGAPADWTIGINYTSPALRVPQDLAVDSRGVVWALSTPGTAATGSSTVATLTVGGLGVVAPQTFANYAAIALDTSDSPWVVDSVHNDVVELNTAGTRAAGPFTGGGIRGPGAIAFDPAGNVWVANNSATVSELNASGGAVSPGAGYATGGASGPVALAIDAGGQVWTADSAGNSVSKLSNAGVLAVGAPYTGSGLNGPFSIAIDAGGNAEVANRTGSTVTVLAGTGTPPAGTNYGGAGVSSPLALAVDGQNGAWVVNAGTGSLSALGAGGVAKSGPLGYGSAFLMNPYRLAIDASGNVWVANVGTRVAGSGVVTQIVGAAAPVVTPLSVAVQRGLLGQRP